MEIYNKKGDLIFDSADLRSANLYSADLRDADLRSANLRSADLRVADLRGADLCGAELRDADLRSADLRVADLRGADLCGAELRGADLCGAELRGADLCDANLGDMIYIHIKGTRHDLYFLQTLQIEYEIHTIEYWLKNYNDIVNKKKYTQEQIEEYYNYIKICKEIKK